MLRKFSTLLAVSTLFSTLATGAVAYTLAGQHLGSAGSTQSTDRQIELKPGDKYLNVMRGETVLIKSGGKVFAWKFDTLGTPTFNLSEIAPGDFNTHGVRAFVGQNPALTLD